MIYNWNKKQTKKDATFFLKKKKKSFIKFYLMPHVLSLFDLIQNLEKIKWFKK